MEIKDSSKRIETELQAYRYLSDEARIVKQSHTMLYHYTTFESLLYIIKDMRFRLSSSRLLNDKAERKIGRDFRIENNYSLSMTEAKESISMWSMYGRPSGIKLRLGFSKSAFLSIVDSFDTWMKEGIEHIGYVDENHNLRSTGPMKSGFVDDELPPHRFAYVAYLNKRNSAIMFRKSSLFKIDASSIDLLTGLVKYDAWDFEKEIRFLVLVPDNDGDYVYLRFGEELLQSFEITYNPWLSDEMKNVIKNQLNSMAGVKLKYKNSSIDGEVDELRF